MGMTIESVESRAVEAWGTLRPARVVPERVDVLKGTKERKTVCRLAGVGPAGTHVIAKRYRLSTGLVERAIYEEVLPLLRVPALRCYGLVEEANGTRCWLFLEDAGSTRYSTSLAAHRRLAGRWLGLLHTRVPGAPAAGLPDRGPSHYRQYLEQARAAILASHDNPALTAEQAAVLRTILRQLDRLGERWPEIERLCAAMPETVVHGDFVPKNLRVRGTGAGGAILCFDWGCAGWGTPAVDLARALASAGRFSASPSLGEYWSVLRERWPECELDTVRRWASVGSVFRALASLAWASRSLSSAWVDEPVAEMRIALAVIAGAGDAAGRE